MSVTMSDDDQPQVCVQGKSTDLLRIFRPNPQDRWSRKPVASQCGICRCDVERLAVVFVTTTSNCVYTVHMPQRPEAAPHYGMLRFPAGSWLSFSPVCCRANIRNL